MYLEFCNEVKMCEQAVWEKDPYAKPDSVEWEIVMSPKKTFRNDLYPLYKANRPKSPLEGISALRALVMERLPITLIDNVEADDLVCYRANNGQVDYIAAIDKDVIRQASVDVYNYKKKDWHPAAKDIEANVWHQTLTGDATDGIPGIKGVGPKTADKYMKELTAFGQTVQWIDIVNLFGSEEEALLNRRLIDLGQIDDIVDNKAILKLWEPK